jgi:flagellar hook-associated protein 3
MRITNNMITRQVVTNIQRNLQSVADLQNVLSTGRRFQEPGDNPTRFVESLSLRQEMSENRRFQRNITLGQTNLDLTESALATLNDRLQRARQLALQAANSSSDVNAREAIASEIEQILSDVVQQANTNFEGRFIFGGDQTLRTPFELLTSGPTGGVKYRGDFGDRLTEIGRGEFLAVNLTGPDAFYTQVNETRSTLAPVSSALLAPQLAAAEPPVTGVAGTFTVDGVAITFDPATGTLESLRDSINRSVDTADARIDDSGKLVIRSLTSNDVQLANGTSNVLESLGMFHRVTGGAIGAGITGATTLAALGITGDAIEIRAGEDIYKVNLAGAATVGDVITAVSASGAPVEAFINSAGDGLVFSATETVESLEVVSLRRVFGTTALAPGSVASDTTLASLGITPGVLQINNDGAVTNVDLSSATTVGELVTAINTQVNGITASINSDGTALDIESAFFSTTLSAADVGASNIAAVLGFAQTRSQDNAGDFSATSPATADVTQSQNIFKSLSDLVTALRSPEATPEDFNQVLGGFDENLNKIQTNRAVIGARVNRIESSLDRFQAYEVFLTKLLSDNEDADLPETITQLTTQNNILTAALNAGSRILQPTLIDFLR